MMDSEIIDISSLTFENEKPSSEGGKLKSANFGGGLELLMNDKVRESVGKQTSDINLDDLNNLEDELNNLADVGSSESTSYNVKSDIFNISKAGSSPDETHKVRFDDNAGLGEATASTNNANNKTWDGFAKFNDIPINPEKNISAQPQMSKEDMLREKFKYLRKLEALEKKGVELSKKYNMESSLLEMQGEYETIMEEKSKQNSVKFQGNMLMAIINGIEFLNGRFDPFDIKLDGWGEQINENITDYDEVFGELYEKYKSKASMAPELKLLFQLGGGAMMVHMTNTMFKSSMPGMDDILRQNPDLMRQFQNAAVNSMGQSNPGFSGFMSGIMNPEPEIPMGRGPPPPMQTQGPFAAPPSVSRGGNNSYAPRPNFSANGVRMDDGINIQENFARPDEAERSSRRLPPRPEMKGPSDISEILSGLKTKTINIQDPGSLNNDSTISVSDLKDLQNDGNMPKKSKRRQKSDKNTVSLDI
jgi:hypothetical protein